MFGMFRSVMLLVLLSSTLWGCGGSPNLLKEIPRTINTVKYTQHLVKTVPLALIDAPKTPLGQNVGQLYFSTLVDAVRNEDSRSNLLTPGDHDFPSYMTIPVKDTPGKVHAAGLSAKSRTAGHQGIVMASVHDIRAFSKKTGIFWLRKTRHFINYTVTVVLYDPYTAAKIVNEVREGTINISAGEYDAYLAGTVISIPDLNEAIEAVAKDLGDIIGGALKHQQWRAAVTGIEDDRIVIPADRRSGLKEGDRLAVFGGRRRLKGIEGASYVVPGIQVAEIRITSVNDGMAEAKSLTSNRIQSGDIVVPLK
jgi:hypothetical protein